MTDHKFTVETPERVICFSLTPDEAALAAQWLEEIHGIAKAAAKDLTPRAPMILNELLGGFKAIAENRPYGGH